jgi:hypothetical protein
MTARNHLVFAGWEMIGKLLKLPCEVKVYTRRLASYHTIPECGVPGE